MSRKDALCPDYDKLVNVATMEFVYPFFDVDIRRIQVRKKQNRDVYNIKKKCLIFFLFVLQKLLSISIVIPVYNVEPYIADCLLSVMRQTYQGPIECIVVDDACTDNSMTIAKELIAGYEGPIEFKVLCHENNMGISAARNTGMDAASGDYLLYIDSDDYLSDDCLEVLARPLHEKLYDMVVGNFAAFGGESNARLWVEQGGVYEGDRLRKACFSKEVYIAAWNKLYSLCFLRHHNLVFFEGILMEDVLWNYCVVQRLSNMCVVKDVTYHYRIRRQSIMGQIKMNLGKTADSSYAIVKQIIDHEFVENTGYEPERMAYINSFFLKYMMRDFGNKARMRALYMYVREHWDYSPMKLFRAGLMPASQVKKHLYYVLPPLLGWWYLYLKIWKNSRK